MSGLIEITSTYWVMGDFDSRFPYLKRNDAAPSFYLVAGPTIDVGIAANGGLSWSYKVPGLQISDYPTDGNSAPIVPTNTPVPVSY
jgi:hypothetical protein